MTQYLNRRSWGTFSLKLLVEEVIQSLSANISDHGIIAFIDIPLEQVIVADRKLLRRAVQHLMLNAIGAMPDGGSLVTTSATTAGAVELEIADTGPALSDEGAAWNRPPIRGGRFRRAAAIGRNGSPHHRTPQRKHLGRQLP